MSKEIAQLEEIINAKPHVRQYKFVYARHKVHPKMDRMHEQWYLLLDSFQAVDDYTELRAYNLMGKYLELRRDAATIRAGHFSDRDKELLHMALTCTTERKNIADDLNVVVKYANVFQESFAKWGKALVVSPNNAFRHVDDSFEFLMTKTTSSLIFPVSGPEDIKITKWPEGTHFYATVGNQTVYDADQNMKWDTEEEARRHAMNALEKAVQNNWYGRIDK